MKFFHFMSIAIAIVVCGCGSTGNRVSIADYQDIKPLAFPAKFSVSASADNPEGRHSESPFFTYDSENLLTLWEEILSEDPRLKTDAQRPAYTFQITLLYLISTYFPYSPADIDFHGGALFRLTVLDANGDKIHTRLFKIYGYWNGDGMGGVKGPAEMGYSRPTQAIIKLGLYDVLSYICRGDFLHKESGPIEHVNHILADMKFRLGMVKVFTQNPLEKMVSDNPITYYNVAGAGLVYFRWIMGESLTAAHELYGVAWEEAGEYEMVPVFMVAKLALVKDWPLFPPELIPDVNRLPYRFD